MFDIKKYQTFKTAMIGNIIGNKAIIGDGFDDIEKVFDDYWLTIAKPVFLEENNITKSFIENLEKNDLKNYLIYTPFDLNKQRKGTFDGQLGLFMLDRVFRCEFQSCSSIWNFILEFEEFDVVLKGFFQGTFG